MATAVVDDEQEEQDDNIAIIYKEDSVGKDVWIKFPVVAEEEDDNDEEDDEGGEGEFFKFFQGTITGMQVAHEDDDVNKPKQYTHYVKFGDSDDGYYDLSDLEMTGYLKWEDPYYEQQQKKSVNGRVGVTTGLACLTQAQRDYLDALPKNDSLYGALESVTDEGLVAFRITRGNVADAEFERVKGRLVLFTVRGDPMLYSHARLVELDLLQRLATINPLPEFQRDYGTVPVGASVCISVPRDMFILED